MIRRAGERGFFDHGWLRTWHSFSFGGYHDPQQMGFRSLRVINEDVIAGGTGFPRHPHRNMEILTYVISGAIEHIDSAGNRSVVGAGEVQRMSAGSGIYHSEANASATDDLHLLQIWIQPARAGITPGYEQKRFDVAGQMGKWQRIASPDGRDGSLTIHQDAHLHAIRLLPGQSADQVIAENRGAWLQVVSGASQVEVVPANDCPAAARPETIHLLTAGDGFAIDHGQAIRLTAGSAGLELLHFDLA